jgi:alkanesulfonate monooxygenase SsuD/methylene tetrahydromethanopterin reductase-like flavin-dependent oxidoreductase (luciferase family)
MDFSLWPAEWRSWSEVQSLARLCERDGWHGMWFADHLMLDTGSEEPSEGDCLDAWALLPAVAAITERVRLGPLVAPVTYRHPATLASAAATLAHISGDRFVLGVGAGWQKNEHALYGFDLGTQRERSGRLQEACMILRSLLDDDRPQVHGDYFQVDAPRRRPAPGTRIPLLVGGKGEQRTLRTVALHADEWNGWCDAALVSHKLDVLARHCETIGRDPAGVRCSVNTYLAMGDEPDVVERLSDSAGGRPVLAGSPQQIVDQLASLEDAGVDEVVIADWNLDNPTERTETLERFASEVLTAFADIG